VKSQNKLLSGIRSISDFSKVGLNVECEECIAEKLAGYEFIYKLMNHEYVG